MTTSRLNTLALAIPTGFFMQFIPLLPLLIVAFCFLLFDVYTAWSLSRRLRKEGKSTGKLKSTHLERVIDTMIKIMAVILLAWALETYVLTMLNTLYLPNWVAGTFCVVQAVSILENISSGSGAAWAKVLQKVLVDKSKRHYDIDINPEKEKKNENVQSKDTERN